LIGEVPDVEDDEDGVEAVAFVGERVGEEAVRDKGEGG